MKTVKVGRYKFGDFNTMSRKRAETLYEKEADTIKFIEASGDGDIVFDIGANVGIYTIPAAKLAKHVYAFEPHIGNAWALIQNIKLNGLENKVTVITDPVSSSPNAGYFNYARMEIGSSNHQFGMFDGEGKPLENIELKELKQGFCIDTVWSQRKLPLPTRAKIDVDGNELYVLEGMVDILSGGSIKEMIVEYNLFHGDDVTNFLKRHGYEMVEKQLTMAGKRKHRNGVPIDKIPHNRLYRLNEIGAV